MKQLSSMMVGAGLDRFQHAADADAAREVHVLADLGAGADGGPGVDHRAFIDVGADVDVGRHQHHVLRDEGTAARGGRRHDAEAAGAKSSPSWRRRTWSVDLVEEAHRAVRHDQALS